MQFTQLANPLGDFIVGERIGRGGMAAVYRARQKSVNRDVALKVIVVDDPERKPDFYERFALEARLIASLEHTSIVPLYDFGVHDSGVAYLAMRLMRGGTLSDALRAGSLPLMRAVEITTQVGRALQYAHNRNIVHRDLKPSNILLDEHGNAYLGDFGLAKLMAGSTGVSAEGQVSGSIAYISPEQAQGSSVDHRADIYGLGMLLYHMLIGRPAFEASSPMALLYKQVHEPPTPPEKLNPAVSRALSTVVLRALEKDPERRFQTVDAMLVELNLAAGSRYSTNEIHVVTHRIPHPPRRFDRRLLVLPVLVVLALAAGVFVWLSSRTPPLEILYGRVASLEMLQPTDGEISAARGRLGGSGFIAYLPCTLDSASQAERARIMSEHAAAWGINMRVYDSQNDANNQSALIETARQEGAGAFILCALTLDTLGDALQTLEENRLPLAFAARVNAPYGLKLGADYYRAGLRVGRAAGALYGTQQAATVILIPINLSTGTEFADGVTAGLQETAPLMQVVGRWDGAFRENAAHAVRGALAEGIDVDAIISMTDSGAIGAVDALKEAGIAPDTVNVYGAGASPVALDYIQRGEYIRGSLSFDSDEGSHLLLYGVIKLLAGSPVPEHLNIRPGEIVTASD